MAKTIKAALRDEIGYPLKGGFFENKLIERGINGDDDYTSEVAKGDSFRGAVADCIKALILSPNISEGDISISLTDKDRMLRIANSIYASIGEDSIDIADKPIVYIES